MWLLLGTHSIIFGSLCKTVFQSFRVAAKWRDSAPLVSHPLVTQYTCQYEEKEEDFNVLRLTGRTGNGINDAEGDGLLIGFILDC